MQVLWKSAIYTCQIRCIMRHMLSSVHVFVRFNTCAGQGWWLDEVWRQCRSQERSTTLHGEASTRCRVETQKWIEAIKIGCSSSWCGGETKQSKSKQVKQSKSSKAEQTMQARMCTIAKSRAPVHTSASVPVRAHVRASAQPGTTPRAPVHNGEKRFICNVCEEV